MGLSQNKDNIPISAFKEFKTMTKAGLSISVVFSTIAGYFLAVLDWSEINFFTVFMLAIGGYCMVGASNVYNQIIEKDLDSKMKRTRNRPIASGRVKPSMAFIFAVILTVLGVIILYSISPKTAMFSSIAIFLYACVYTPLKTVTPLSVFFGSIPGAIPFMLGWVAVTNRFGIEAGMLFLIQFFWQFPHFWAIGWLLDDDYKKAGFKMLPTGKRDNKTAFLIILYIVWLIIISLFPAIGVTGRLFLSPIAAVLVFIVGLGLLYSAVVLYKKRTNKAAYALMIASVSYISLIQIIYVIDKYFR